MINLIELRVGFHYAPALYLSWRAFWSWWPWSWSPEKNLGFFHMCGKSVLRSFLITSFTISRVCACILYSWRRRGISRKIANYFSNGTMRYFCTYSENHLLLILACVVVYVVLNFRVACDICTFNFFFPIAKLSQSFTFYWILKDHFLTKNVF